MAMGGLPAADLPQLRSRMSDEDAEQWITAVETYIYNKMDDDPRMNTDKFGRPYPARDRSPKAIAVNLCWAIMEARCGLARGRSSTTENLWGQCQFAFGFSNRMLDTMSFMGKFI